MDFPWRAKLRRADEHRRHFAACCDDYLKAANVRFEYETDRTAGTICVRLEADAEPPTSLGTIIGDVLHNLRSALDAVAWETCQRAGVPAGRESRVYFPIGIDPEGWKSLAADKLPCVSPEHLSVFERLQPWFWDVQARESGVEVEHSWAEWDPLVQLHRLARDDRHRLPHLVLARAGLTWIGSPEGVEITAAPGAPWPAKPGDKVLTWQVDPAERVSELDPSGDVILALSERGAQNRRSAFDELESMQQSVINATRHVEIHVLEVVTSTQLAELDELGAAHRATIDARRRHMESLEDIDRAFIEQSSRLDEAEEAARVAYVERWRELFD